MSQASSPSAAPSRICILRTSAIGDVTHVVPLVRTLQTQWPQTQLTWLVGSLEQKLVGDLPGVEFIAVSKRGQRQEARAALAGRSFDVLLHLQVSMRANLLSRMVRAPLRIGYDRARSKDLHGLFVNCRIPARSGEHVLDAMGSFLEPLGIMQHDVRWDIPLDTDALEFAQRHIPAQTPTLLVSPVSSHVLRNWSVEGYAAVIDHLALNHGWQVILCGGPSQLEREFGDAIRAKARAAVVDLIGKDTLKQLLALQRRATLLLSPDSGPMHMANSVGTPVLGLHAASNPHRSGPYTDRRWCVDRYDEAARKYRRKPAEALPWGTKLEFPGVMDLIGIDDVIERAEAFIAAGMPRAGEGLAEISDKAGTTSPQPASSPA